MKLKIYLLSLGCPRNLVDSEVLTGVLEKGGFEITGNIDDAKVYVVNTCAFIDKAKQESIDAILEMVSLKIEGNLREKKQPKKLIVTGCLPQRYADELKKEIPEIDGIFGSSDFIKIPDFINSSVKRKKTNISKTPLFLYDHKSKRSLITPKHYAYVKIQEGCMNNCSYCVIPRLRGPYRSRTLDSVVREVKALRDDAKVKEINIIGQDTTLYGIDRYGATRISELLRKLRDVMSDGWIRLLYTHPSHFNDELIELIAENGPVCKYVDLPIQHINDTILKRMNRGISKKDILTLIKKIRAKIPQVAIRTSVIVGFPGETEVEFDELLRFIKDMKFERLGAFTYSREKGTKAYDYKGHISNEEKEKRYETVLKTQQEISLENNRLMLGKVLDVIIDEKSNSERDMYIGRTRIDAPEVDGLCYIKSQKRLKNGTFKSVRITNTLEYDLVGEMV